MVNIGEDLELDMPLTNNISIIEHFLHVVQNDEFVEGHEVLEDLWKEWKNQESLREESFILKGLINGSTALALKIMGRDEPASRVWATFLKYSSLIDEIQSVYTPKYIEARNLLYKKNLQYKVN